ncbi:MAG: hypothetical protein QNK36_04990 [Colwellia sp.]|nr:hypothetical protein [Colwellia sp.]
MEHFNFLSYEYYKAFYSYKGYLIKFFLHIPITFFFGVLFIFTLLDFTLLMISGKNFIALEQTNPFGFEQQGLKDIAKIYSFGIVMIAEIIFIPTFLSLNHRKEKETILRVSKKLNVRDKTLTDLKKLWLSRVFKDKPYEYLSISESAIKGYEIIDKNIRPFDFSRNRFYKIFYEETAKTRILSLLIALISILSIISLRGQNNSEILFKEIYHTPTSLMILLLITLTIFLKLTLLTIKLLSITTVIFIESVNAYVDKPNARNEYISKILISDLVKYSRLELNTVKTI